jgi:hypothetical protein
MKPAIPTAKTGKPDVDMALSAVKQTLDEMTGQARNSAQLQPLPDTASTADIIRQLNAILARIQ